MFAKWRQFCLGLIKQTMHEKGWVSATRCFFVIPDVGVVVFPKK